MKKFYMILAALLIGSVCFAQKTTALTQKAIAPQSNQTRATGWYGSATLQGYQEMTNGAYFIMRPETYTGATTAGEQLTKIKFYIVSPSQLQGEDATTYAGYTNLSYTIKIYEGSAMDEDLLTDGYTENNDAVLGTLVRTIPYTATASGEQIVELSEPYTITSANYWVAIVCNGNSLLATSATQISSNTVTLAQWQANERPEIPDGAFDNVHYLLYEVDESLDIDVPITASYTDNTYSAIAYYVLDAYLQIYVQGSGAYVENSDVSAGFLNTYPNPTSDITTLTISTTEDLVVYPYVQNNGPDAIPTDQSVNVTITINGVNPYEQEIPMQWDAPLGSGYYSPVQVSEAYGLTFAASDLDALGVPSEFDVCITATYTGVDNNSANNTACLHVTRGGETPQTSSDLEAMLFLDAQGATEVGATMTLAGDDDFLVFPAIKNNGPDAASSGTVTINVTMDGSPLIQPQSLALSSQMSIPSGQVVGITQSGLSLTAAQMDQYGITGTFEICYTITYSGTDPNTANNSKCVTVTRQSVAVEENIAEEVSVYPNPANDMFTVANAEGATIVVVNSLGQVIASIENAASNQTIDASNFANGTYFVKVNESVIKINVVK